MANQGYVYNQKYWNEIDFNAVEKLSKIAADHGKSLPQFALAWVLNKKGITSMVCGATSVGKLEENIGAVGVQLSKEELNACDEVWHDLRRGLFYGR